MIFCLILVCDVNVSRVTHFAYFNFGCGIRMALSVHLNACPLRSFVIFSVTVASVSTQIRCYHFDTDPDSPAPSYFLLAATIDVDYFLHLWII